MYAAVAVFKLMYRYQLMECLIMSNAQGCPGVRLRMYADVLWAAGSVRMHQVSTGTACMLVH
jgi:hypothetical protein